MTLRPIKAGTAHSLFDIVKSNLRTLRIRLLAREHPTTLEQRIVTSTDKLFEVPSTEFHELNRTKLSELQKEVREMEDLFKQYERRPLSLGERTELTEAKQDLAELNTVLETELSRTYDRQSAPEVSNEGPEAVPPQIDLLQENVARVSILDRTIADTELQQAGPNLVIPAVRIVAQLKRGISANQLASIIIETVIGTPASATVTETPASATVIRTPASATVTETPASTTIIRTPASATVTETPASTTIIRTPASATQELLSRQIVTFIARALAKELVITRDRDKGSAGPIGPRQVEEAVDHFNAVRPAALEKVKMEVSFNREKNAVQIAVTGDLQPAAAAEVILADPQAALPALIETTAAMISSRPDSAEEIVKTVAAIVEQITIRDPAKAAELSEIMVKDLHADQQTIANAPTHHEAQTAQTMAEAKIRVAGHVAAALPEHFIPALVAQHSAATTEKAQKTIEPLVRQAAGTVAGASHVIDKVAQDKTGEFAASSAGKIAIVEAAGSIIGKASEAQHSEPAAVPATLHLLLPAIKAPAVKEIVAKELTVKDTAVKKTAVKETDKAAQIITIARLVIAANPGKFSPANLTEETAQTFIGFVARVQKSLAPVAAKKTSRAKPAAVRTINHHVRYQARTPISPAKQFAAQAMQQGNVPERARALNEVLTYARENNLMVPKAIIQNIFAGLAGVLPQAVRAEISFLPALSGESASSSSLKRITAMLEAQMTQAVARKSAPAWDRVFVLSAQAFLYGTIMRLVKGRIGRVDEVIEQLRQRGVLGRIIRGIKEGNLDLVADYLSDLVLETEVKGILNALAA